MEYHALVFALYQAQVGTALPSAVLPALALDSGKAVTRDNIAVALARLETIARLYYIRHSFEHCDSFLTFFLSTLGLATLAALELEAPAGDSESYKSMLSTVILCIKGLYDQGQHVHIAAAVYRLLRGRLSARILEAVEGQVRWDPADEDEPLIAQHIQSQWPLTIIGLDRDPEMSTLDNLARQYDQMSLASDGASQRNSPSTSQRASAEPGLGLDPE